MTTTRGEFRIESRSESWARWRIVTPLPHGERFPFDFRGLKFDSRAAAEHAADLMRRHNGCEFRVIEIVSGPSLTEARNMGANV